MSDQPTLTFRGNSIPTWTIVVALVSIGGSIYAIGSDRATQLAEIKGRFERIEGRQAEAQSMFASSVTRIDAERQQASRELENIRMQQAGLERNAAVTAEKLVAIAASIAEIQRLLAERPRRTSTDIGLESSAARAVARRDGLPVRRERGVWFAGRPQ